MDASAWGLSILVVVADAWALAYIVQRRGRPVRRALWAAAVLTLPLLGVAAWLLLGPATLPARAPEAGRPARPHSK